MPRELGFEVSEFGGWGGGSGFEFMDLGCWDWNGFGVFLYMLGLGFGFSGFMVWGGGQGSGLSCLGCGFVPSSLVLRH